MIGEIGEIFEWFIGAFSGWRYIFSKSYRKSKHEDWKNESKLYVMWDFILGAASVVFSIGVIYFILSLVVE